MGPRNDVPWWTSAATWIATLQAAGTQTLAVIEAEMEQRERVHTKWATRRTGEMRSEENKGNFAKEEIREYVIGASCDNGPHHTPRRTHPYLREDLQTCTASTGKWYCTALQQSRPLDLALTGGSLMCVMD